MKFFRFMRVLVIAACKLIWRLKYVGQENCNQQGPYILCPKHISIFDVVPVAQSSKRPVHFLAKKELFRSWPGKTFFSAMGAVPVDRQSNDIQAIKKSLILLKNGEPMAVFPEGTRVKSGEMGDVHEGAMLLALRTDAKVIPGGIAGKYRLWGKVVIYWGEPLMLDDLRAKKTDQAALTEATRRLREAMIDLTQRAREML